MEKSVSTFFKIFSGMAIGMTIGALRTKKNLKKDIDKKQDLSEKHMEMFLIMNQWMKKKIEGKCLQDYFEKNNYKSVAIYGMSYIGERLFEELKDSGIMVKYGIDKCADGIYMDVDVVSLDGELKPVDVVVVTPIHYYEVIESELSKKVDCPIISIEDVVYDL